MYALYYRTGSTKSSRAAYADRVYSSGLQEEQNKEEEAVSLQLLNQT